MEDLIEFAQLDPFYFDRRTGRYRHKSTEQPVERTVILKLLQRNIGKQGRELVVLGDRLAAKEIDFRQFQEEAAVLLKRLHVQSAILGHEGIETMTPEDWIAVAQELKRQYYAGIDPQTGRRFGLRFLADSIRQGLLSLPQIRHALTQFGKSAKVSYYRAFVSGQRMLGKRYAVRVLGNTEHCEDCLRYAALPPQSITEIVLPTQQCRCRTECKCSILPLTLEEAIARTNQR